MEIVAIKAFRYAGAWREVGDRFEASERDGRVLCAIGKAEAAAKALPEVTEPKPKRTYRRRDMQAE